MKQASPLQELEFKFLGFFFLFKCAKVLLILLQQEQSTMSTYLNTIIISSVSSVYPVFPDLNIDDSQQLNDIKLKKIKKSFHFIYITK